MMSIPVAMLVAPHRESRATLRTALHPHFEIMEFEHGDDMIEMLNRIIQRVRMVIIDTVDPTHPNSVSKITQWVDNIMTQSTLPDVFLVCQATDHDLIQHGYHAGARGCMIHPLSDELLTTVTTHCLTDTNSEKKLCQALIHTTPTLPDGYHGLVETLQQYPHPDQPIDEWTIPFFQPVTGHIVIAIAPHHVIHYTPMMDTLTEKGHALTLCHTIEAVATTPAILASSTHTMTKIDIVLVDIALLEQPLATYEPIIPNAQWALLAQPGQVYDIPQKMGWETGSCMTHPSPTSYLHDMLHSLFKRRAMATLLSTPYRPMTIQHVLPLSLRIPFFQRLIDNTSRVNRPIYFRDVVALLPELAASHHAEDDIVDTADLSDGALVYTYELQSRLLRKEADSSPST